jgi:inner membrane protein
MDSLSHIVLGAAVGEAVLGRKIGNRAMLWGAVAGSFPDLDIIANIWMSELDALVFHRGPTHSFFYTIFMSAVVSWLIHRFYRMGWHQNKIYRIISSMTALIAMLMVSTGVSFLVYQLGGREYSYLWGGILLFFTVFLSYRLWVNYTSREKVFDVQLNQKDWYKMVFIAMFTHSALDCFTTYGTTVLLPFSDARIAFNNIAVADPFWTFPFMVFVIVASFYSKEQTKRSLINYTGIAVSSAYLIFTLFNKLHVDKVVQHSIEKEKIEVLRYMTTPTILNNILWTTTIETEKLYYIGTYSLFDKEPYFKLTKVAKNHELLPVPEKDRTVKTLRWFSNDFYNVFALDENMVQYNDLRFGVFEQGQNEKDNFVFSFFLVKDAEGNTQMAGRKDRPSRSQQENFFPQLFNRIMGI